MTTLTSSARTMVVPRFYRLIIRSSLRGTSAMGFFQIFQYDIPQLQLSLFKKMRLQNVGYHQQSYHTLQNPIVEVELWLMVPAPSFALPP